MAPPALLTPSLRTFALAAQEAYTHATVRTNGTEVLFKWVPEGLIVAFRGTDEARDILTDAWGWPVRDPDLGWCHAGFLHSTREMWPLIRDPLFKHLMGGKAVWLTGHSKGGAEATLTAGLMLSDLKLPPDGLVTFGGPRAGGWRLLRALAPVPLRRVVDQGDPVPWVPPPGLLVHPGTDMDQLLLPHPPDLRLDHPIARYVELIPPEVPAFLL